jgi:hypothetical protein
MENRWSRYVGKETKCWIFSDLVHSWVFLTAMLVDFMVKIVEIEPYISLLWKPEHAKEPFMTSYGKCQIMMILIES